MMARSRSLGIEVSIYLLDRDRSRAPLGVYVPLLEQIASSSRRWKSISMNMPESLIDYLCGLSAGASRIPIFQAHITQSLTVSGPVQRLNNGVPFSSQVQFSPQVVRLSDLHSVLNLKIRWERVTTMSIDQISVGQCALILRLAPVLSSCTFSVIHLTPADTTITNVIHRNLRDLTCGIGASGLFLKLTLPNLRRLIFRASSSPTEGDQPGQRLLAFLERSSCPLSELWFCESSFSFEYFMSVFKLIPSLSRLSISTVPHDESVAHDPTIKELLEYLASTTIFPSKYVEDNDDATGILLPNLVSISFSGLCTCPFPWDIVPTLFSPNFNTEASDVTAACRPLKSVKVSVLRGHNGRGLYPYILEPVLSQLIELRDAGAEIIYVDETNRNIDLFQRSVAYWIR